MNQNVHSKMTFR